MSENDDTRSLGADGTQTDSEQLPGQAGPPISSGGEQVPGGPVPPYDGRQTSAPVDEGGSHRDGANVGGATGPTVSDGPADPGTDSQSTPADEQPAGDGDGRPQEDPGVGPDHYSGTGRAEDKA